MFDPKDFFTLGSKLQSPIADEACLRTSISRYYYSAFLVYREHLSNCGHYVQKRNGEDHQGVITTLGQLGERLSRDHLDSLRQARSKADYQLHYKANDKDVKAAKIIAELLLKHYTDIK
jgi:hypothetical protein